MSLSFVAAVPVCVRGRHSVYRDPILASGYPSNPAAASRCRGVNVRSLAPTRAVEHAPRCPMNDLFALTSPNIYIARFFSKEPGPNSTFFKLSARHAFWDLNCYQISIIPALWYRTLRLSLESIVFRPDLKVLSSTLIQRSTPLSLHRHPRVQFHLKSTFPAQENIVRNGQMKGRSLIGN